MKEILYCIEHNVLEFVQNSPVGICHDYTVLTEFGIEADWCMFDLGWATCPPPEEYPDWDLVEPQEEVEEEIDWDEFNETILESYEMEESDVMGFRTKVWSFGSPD